MGLNDLWEFNLRQSSPFHFNLAQKSLAQISTLSSKIKNATKLPSPNIAQSYRHFAGRSCKLFAHQPKLINIACRSERMLPTAAHLQLINIEQAMETLPPGPGSPFISNAPLIQHFTQRAQELRYEAATMERYIGKYELKMRQWVQREKFWLAAGTIVPEGVEGKRQTEWLNLLLPTLMHAPGQADNKYYRFKTQMPLLQKEAETYEKWLKQCEDVSISLPL